MQHTNGAYIKDLTCVDEDLESVALIDNSPVSYQFHQGPSPSRALHPSPARPPRPHSVRSTDPPPNPFSRAKKANGIPIDGWFSDPADQALLDLLPVLDSLRFTGDVRHVLGLRGF